MAKQLSEICINVEDTNDNFVGVKYDKKDIQIIFPLGYRIPEDNKEKIEAIKLLFKTIKLSHDKKIDYEDSGDFKEGANGLPIDSFQWVINDYLDNGIYIAPSQFEAMFVSDAHTNEDINRTIEVMEEFFRK